jgi:hypothetical protein
MKKGAKQCSLPQVAKDRWQLSTRAIIFSLDGGSQSEDTRCTTAPD